MYNKKNTVYYELQIVMMMYCVCFLGEKVGCLEQLINIEDIVPNQRFFYGDNKKARFNIALNVHLDERRKMPKADKVIIVACNFISVRYYFYI